jgi:hypothetical protein
MHAGLFLHNFKDAFAQDAAVEFITSDAAPCPGPPQPAVVST